MTSDIELLDEADVDPIVPADALAPIYALILAWPNLEAEIAIWLVNLMGVEPAEGFVFTEKMDAGQRLERIRSLLQQRGLNDQAAGCLRLKQIYTEYSRARNAVVHYPIVGMLRTDTRVICFAPFKFSVKNGLTQSIVLALPLDEISKVAVWAQKATELLREYRSEPSQ